MIQIYSRLTVADNSGARQAMCIGIPNASKRRYAGVGDIITVTIKDALPRGVVRKKTVERAVIIRTKKEIPRPDGTYVRFDDNACVVIGAEKEPKGTRVFGPVARELRDRGYQKIISLACEVL